MRCYWRGFFLNLVLLIVIKINTDVMGSKVDVSGWGVSGEYIYVWDFWVGIGGYF